MRSLQAEYRVNPDAEPEPVTVVEFLTFDGDEEPWAVIVAQDGSLLCVQFDRLRVKAPGYELDSGTIPPLAFKEWAT